MRTTRLGVLVGGLLTIYPAAAALAQSQQVARWAPPSPCTGDSTETHVRRGSTIAVPALDSITILRARATLARLGLKIDVRSVRIDGPAGVVIGQAPQAGTSVASGDVVIVCSRRSPSMPNVVGLTFDAAKKTLADAGYDAIRINSFVDRAAQMGVVFRQQPIAGEGVPRGGADTLIVGMAPPIASVVRTPAAPGQPGARRPASDTTSVVVQAQLRAPVDPLPDAPIDWRWLWALAAGASGLGAARVMRVKVKDRRRLAAFRVVPHQDSGRPRLVSARQARNGQ